VRALPALRYERAASNGMREVIQGQCGCIELGEVVLLACVPIPVPPSVWMTACLLAQRRLGLEWSTVQ